jgi:hypothetical protein
VPGGSPGVYSYVTKHVATRLLRNLILGVLAALFVLTVTIRVQQYVFRSRSERLLEQVRALGLGHATFAETQQIFREWPSARDTGPCVPLQCDFEIGLSDFGLGHLQYFVNYRRVLRVYEFLGGRLSAVRVKVSVRNGIVWGKFFDVRVTVSEREDRVFDSSGYWLMGRASTVESIDTARWPSQSHPEYRIGQPSGCKICVEVYTIFTPTADPRDIERLTEFDYSCLTRWTHPCRTQGDIMPAAWKEAQDERAAKSTR